MSDRLRVIHNTGDEDRPRPRVVLLGATASAELAEVRQELAALVPADSICQLESISELADDCACAGVADLIVVVQTWSDEYPFSALLKSVPGIGPFTRLLCCYGPWCVSDGRSRQDWPLALRVPLEHFRRAFLQEWQNLTPPAMSVPHLPWTAGRDEIFKVRHSAVTLDSNPKFAGAVRVISPDRQLAQFWQALLHHAGLPTTNHADSIVEQTILWDVDPWSDDITTAWQTVRERGPTTRIFALQGFVTPDETRRLIGAGATGVISKLLPLDDLLAAINQSCEQRVLKR